jgi:hypothetical protein
LELDMSAAVGYDQFIQGVNDFPLYHRGCPEVTTHLRSGDPEARPAIGDVMQEIIERFQDWVAARHRGRCDK